MSKHVLTIDDEAEIRGLLSDVLGSAGYRVSAVGTLAEALPLLRADPPAVIITDLQLGDSDGFELIERVKAIDASVPIILLTGVLMDPEEIPPAVARQIAAYVPKTASLEAILQEVRKCCR